MAHENINRNIKNNAFYMINLFNQKKEKSPNKKISITNLKLQKLMYFVEAYYMVKNPDEDKMFNEKWSAWDYGPVCKELYDQFKVFGSIEITISEEESMIGDELSKENKEYIDDIFEIFGELPAFHLVTLTHMKGSPWNKIYESNKNTNKYDFKKINKSTISKKETKEWFEDVFDFIFEDTKEENK